MPKQFCPECFGCHLQGGEMVSLDRREPLPPGWRMVPISAYPFEAMYAYCFTSPLEIVVCPRCSVAGEPHLN